MNPAVSEQLVSNNFVITLLLLIIIIGILYYLISGMKQKLKFQHWTIVTNLQAKFAKVFKKDRLT